jgi:hypothetical protein
MREFEPMQVDLLVPQGDLSIEQEIRITEIGGEHGVVVLRHRAQQQGPRVFEQQFEMRQDTCVAVIQPFGTAGVRAHVAAMIEYGEGVAVLQGQSSPLLQRRAGGNIELRDGCFVRGQCIHVSAPVLR